MTRRCGSCNKCCEGWLHGVANGRHFWPGRKCHFLIDHKCSIYRTRPEDPCRSYTCQWLTDEEVPGWMKPDEVNAILTKRKVGDTEYLDLAEAGETLRAEVLSWAILHTLQTKGNLLYRISGGVNRIGSQEFLEVELG